METASISAHSGDSAISIAIAAFKHAFRIFFEPLTWLKHAGRRDKRDFKHLDEDFGHYFLDRYGDPETASKLNSADSLLAEGKLEQAEQLYFGFLAREDDQGTLACLVQSRLARVHLKRDNPTLAAKDLLQWVLLCSAARTTWREHFVEDAYMAALMRMGMQDACMRVTRGLIKTGNLSLAEDLLKRVSALTERSTTGSDEQHASD
jgi:hypothetical protein